MKLKKSLETKHLILRKPEKSFINKIIDYYTENNNFLKRWVPERKAEFFTHEFQKKLLENDLKKIIDDKMYKFWIFEKVNEEKIIGCIVINEIVRGIFQSCFLGYKISEDTKNKGYITEAVAAIKNYAFNDLLLHRIEANIIPRNKYSIIVVEKNEFENEGLSKKYLKINGVWENHIHMVALNENL